MAKVNCDLSDGRQFMEHIICWRNQSMFRYQTEVLQINLSIYLSIYLFIYLSIYMIFNVVQNF